MIFAKELEKKMNFKEVSKFLEKNKKFRLLDIEELNTIENVNISHLRDSTENNRRVFIYYFGKIFESTVHKKIPVVLAYSEEYTELLASIIVGLIGNKLREFISYLPKQFAGTPIYVLGDKYSFESFNDHREFMMTLEPKKLCYMEKNNGKK